VTPRAVRALAMSGLFGLLALACEDTVRVEAYLDEEPRPMFGGIRVLRGEGSTGKDRLVLIASDQPVDCSKLGTGRLVMELRFYAWRPGSHGLDVTVKALDSESKTPRMRWAFYLPSSSLPATVSPGQRLGGHSSRSPTKEVRQESAPTRRGDRARFELPVIRVATLPAVDPRSCCAQHDSDLMAPVCSEECPLPVRIERLGTALDVELCDDIDPSTIEREL
jgi:hypothetical protein